MENMPGMDVKDVDPKILKYKPGKGGCCLVNQGLIPWQGNLGPALIRHWMEP